jgi:rhamnopyranosyl-N-acetylglucosaminyl-diphospho-decaprenol beta-1,3/1,4-galactofuranosyltransferase
LPDPTIAAVIVTYNRLALLKGCIAAVRAQSRPAQEIIVVDNGCTDGSSEWLAEQSDLTIIRQENQGSSGGQLSGINAACAAGYDWIWCMDDDTEPTPTALERLLAAPASGDPGTGFLGSLVTWTDGTAHFMNSPDPMDQYSWYHTVLQDHCVRIGYCSFVSLLVRREAVERVGLPMRDFFIWFDDVEFTHRIGAFYRGYLVLDSVVLHRTRTNLGIPTGQISDAELPRYCYGLRNHVYVHRKTRLPVVKRAARIGWLLWKNAAMVARGDASPRVLLWGLRGLFYSPEVEFPTLREPSR